MRKHFLENVVFYLAAAAGFNVFAGNYGFAVFVSLLVLDLIAYRIADAAIGAKP